MPEQNDREYVISIGARILELLGPSLYTNIYYILAELIANAYDANAKNVYIIQKTDSIIVEDDGTGMSYEDGDIKKYLNVAVETRSTESQSYTEGRLRKRMGRKGVGKLAALSVSEQVRVMTVKNNEKSGFILARQINPDHKLQALTEEEIQFEHVSSNGTSVVMTKPQYKLNKTADSIKNNLLKIFPLVNSDFRIHIITDQVNVVIENFEKEMVESLGAMVVLGEEYHFLSEYFDPGVDDEEKAENLIKLEENKSFPLNLKNKEGVEKNFNLIIKGWLGVYKSTRGRKKDPNDFPDNFISLLSNGKLGEYNILPTVGKNSLAEVYMVGQLHVDLFEETELPDMALSNRQGYKTDDERYQTVISYVRDTLLPQVVEMRSFYAGYIKDEKDKTKQEQQVKDEVDLRKKVDEYKTIASLEITKKLGGSAPEGFKEVIENEMNSLLPIVGLKNKVDSQKKKILISHTREDKILADVIYKMLSFNNIPDEDIIYTSCDNVDCGIPDGESIFDYLRKFFVESYSDKKIFVIYVTSKKMAKKWFPVTEVGAGWITQSKHQVFTIGNHTPQRPLDTDVEWHKSKNDDGNIVMDTRYFDKFIGKIIYICNYLGYPTKSNQLNKRELHRYVTVR